MRGAPILLSLLIGVAACAEPSTWQPLFDGKTLGGWTPKIAGEEAGADSRRTFRAEYGVIRVDYSGYDQFSENFGHLFAKLGTDRYRLRLEYRFIGEAVEGAPAWARLNSGVMIHSGSADEMSLDQDFPVSLEIQFLAAGAAHPSQSTANVCSPETSIAIDGERREQHCIYSDVPSKPLGEWVSVEIVVDGADRIVPYVDGVQSIVIEDVLRDSREPLGTGYLALQSEGHPVEFRNIAWQPLPAKEE
ncbi:DUF1080 domain-containing protein [Parvularcula sp. ZS-1/3]|uniref:DUF1080 domain-containing protein n=1 Tax=Parvularcula mediterranea TaxID=2732508 RepID=A0A7Y3RIS9_9PROT|nr:DUF1080 domain-containing protein [Parvularcula mediterranea]NNU14854.1 DUF1080 domain-containing protein [Parvularcula mediterranea]